MSKRLMLLAVTASLLLAVSPSLLLAQASGAMAYVHGTVKVNGSNVGDSSSVFAGDQIETAPSSAVSINRTGSSIAVNPDSKVKYEGSSIEVMAGSARISTTKGMAAQVGGLTITPKDGSAKFDVINTGNQVVIESHSGALSIDDGKQVTMLAAGVKGEYPMLAGGAAQAVPATINGFLNSNEPLYELSRTDGSEPPWCAATKLCKRASVSKIHYCKCLFYY